MTSLTAVQAQVVGPAEFLLSLGQLGASAGGERLVHGARGGSGSGVASAGEVYAKTGEAEINGGSHSWLTGYRGDLAFATLIVLGGGSEHATSVTNTFFQNLDGK